MDRRTFVRSSLGAVAATVLGAQRAPAQPAPMPRAAGLHTLGKTGLKSSLLGMGTGTKAGGGSSAQNRAGRLQFVRTLAHAYDRGLTYFDLADQYGSHDYFRHAMKAAGMQRDKLMLLTKTNATDAESCRKDLDRFRLEADTDYFDIVLLHCMRAADWAETMKPCMDVLAEAKAQGIIRAHGVSCHDFGAMETAADHPWVDIMLSRINPFGIHMDGPVEDVVRLLQRACDNGKGMLGMKIAGEGACVDRLPESLAFVMGLGCVHAFTMGFEGTGDIDDSIHKIEAIVV
jgi:predicted aldo/keto reductase-like oxidoreductase